MYRHTQTGRVILAAMGVGVLSTLLILLVVPFEPGEEFGRWIVAFTLAILLGAITLLHYVASYDHRILRFLRP